MKNTLKYCFVITISILTFACGDSAEERKDRMNTVKEKLTYLDKSITEIKAIEDPAALMREDKYLLEYEYPIGENESYVITYRFNNNECFEFSLETYLDNKAYANKVVKHIISDMASNEGFKKTLLKNKVYHWESEATNTLVELRTIETNRGVVTLLVKHIN